MAIDAHGLALLVKRAQDGDAEAYDQIVRRFQDMAVGYATSLLGDFDLAQDAAQDAFVQAYQDLPTLHAPVAFAGWFRKIVFKHCDRATRKKRLRAVPLEAIAGVAAPEAGPAERIQRRELQEAVHQAIQVLSPEQQAVVTLFYLGEHTYGDIAHFLGVPVTTVKSRLHVARGRLKEGMTTMDGLGAIRPSRDPDFVARVRSNIAQTLAEFAAGDGREKEIRSLHPAARFRDPHPVFALCGSLIQWAISSGASECHLVPGKTGVGVLLKNEGAMRKVMTLPRSLQNPVAARIKDGANLDVDEQHAPQQGFTPVVCDGTLYDMLVFCVPADQGEKIVLRLVPKNVALS